MKNKYLLNVIIILAVILGLLFYWYEVRLSNIRKTCSANTPLDTVQTKNLHDKANVEQEIKVLDLANKIYVACLHENGITQ